MSKDVEDILSPRRGSRIKKMSIKAVEALQTKAHTETKSRSEEGEKDEDCLDVEKNNVQDSVSSTAMNTPGADIYTFQNKKKLNRVQCETPKSNKKPTNDNLHKTPYILRKKLKQGIKEIVKGDSSDENPFSESNSEYTASEEESSESSDNKSSNSSQSDDSDSEKSVTNTMDNLKQLKEMPKRGDRKYVIKTDEYFSNHSQKKVKTSNHTLDKLNAPKLSQDQLHSLLKNMSLTDEHKKCVTTLSKNYSYYFHKWLYLMQEDFNILLYGLGSKRHILKKFQTDCLVNFPVIVVNGFFPSLTLKDITDAILIDILEVKETAGSLFDACDLIAEKFSCVPDKHLYLIVHNIEGEMLRNNKTQTILSRLAAVKNIHLIASIDHINAPLIWDHNKLSKFKFTWWDVTSFVPYVDETSFESSMMVQKSGNLALSSLKNVFLSLTTNSKGIYLIIVKYQLENQTNQYYQGMLFKDLYWSCREAFLVSSDLALRAQLTEFVDHKMIKFKRSLDGAEYLIIPIQNTLLQQFLNERE